MNSCKTLFPYPLCQKFGLNFEFDSKSGSSRDICVENSLCLPEDKPVLKTTSSLDIRVSKGHGARGYDKVRVSVISNSSISSNLFSYSSQFKYRWTNNFLSTGILSVTPGEKTKFTIGTEDFEVFVPARSEGTRGVLIADPCFTSEFIVCLYGNEFKMFNHTIELLNAINAHDDSHFFMILGDNFYDQSGEATSTWFNALSKESKSKVMASVPGNHDFWINASPTLWTKKDQLGNGFMQMYGQDVAAAVSAEGSGSFTPFDFSRNPDASNTSAYNIPPASNFFWYYMMGNTAFFGYSGAHSYEETVPYLEEACLWAQRENPSAVVLLGHWNNDGDGCESDMTVPTLFEAMKSLPACAPLENKMKYFMGHKHCNYVTDTDVGFMIGGQGMSDLQCNDFGIPVLDTTGGRFKVYFFPIQSHRGYTYYQDTLKCFQDNGVSGCYHLAKVWADTPL